MSLCIERIINNPVPSNCFIIYDLEQSNRCVIIDPGTEDCLDLYRFLHSKNLKPEYVILTHEHFDHIWGCNKIIEDYNVTLVCSSICLQAIKDSKKNHSLFYNQRGFGVDYDKFIVSDDKFSLIWSNYTFDFFDALGHTSSGILILVENYLFTGDSLIKGYKTVTKLLSGSRDKLKETITFINSLKSKGYIVHAGHEEDFLLDYYDTSMALK